ncbi:MAG: Lacal_2735 family protein [Aureispira sp.]|nr:Lacal_2735 family protein [Aureispira sp.]
MFGLFKKKSKKEQLEVKYKKLMEESYKLSHTNRAASSQKASEADDVLKEIEKLK